MASAETPGSYVDPIVEFEKEQAGITDLMPDFWIVFGDEKNPYSPTEVEKKWPFRHLQVEGKHTRLLRQQSDMRHFDVMADFYAERQDLDTMTALWFLARLQNGERVTFADCEDATSMAHFPWAEFSKAEEDPNSPEA